MLACPANIVLQFQVYCAKAGEDGEYWGGGGGSLSALSYLLTIDMLVLPKVRLNISLRVQQDSAEIANGA